MTVVAAHRRRRIRALVGVAAVIGLLGTPAAGADDRVLAASDASLIGQKLMVAMSGTTPSSGLLSRIGRGQIGGVILFGSNVTTPAALAGLSAKLQAAAAAGGQPPLLISTDQEGGAVKRVPWAPPAIAPPDMGAHGGASIARSQGRATGRALACAGVNSDLAPVADVPTSASSFMVQQGRTWSFSAAATASLSDAFTTGLEEGGTVPAMKHFPGIGYATQDTDTHVVTISATRTQLAPGLVPYSTAIGHGVPMIMLSNATYAAYDSASAAGWSKAISVDLLRTTLGFTGVSITDSLSGTAAARGVSATSLAIKAAQAGTDMILLTGSEASSASTYAGLVAAAAAGTIPLATLEASSARILALKAALPATPLDTAGPVAHGPASTLSAPGTLGTTTVPVRTAWSATDSCGIAIYALRRQQDGGGWTIQALATWGTNAIVQPLMAGTVYRYAARATDDAGHTGAWASGRTVEPLVRQQAGGVVAFSTGWRTASSARYSGGSAAYAAVPGASASYRFTGTSVAWVTGIGPTRGSAQVWVDGVKRATVSTHATTTSLRRLAFATSWPTQGTHTIRIVVVGTPGHPRVDVDAFVRLFAP